MVCQAITEFLHRSPVVKSTLVTVLGGAIGYAVPLAQAQLAQGAADPASLLAAAKSGAVAALVALWIKRPKDSSVEDRGGYTKGGFRTQVRQARPPARAVQTFDENDEAAE